MPKQNRPLVRDGRIQARQKRTDRSYLRATPATDEAADAEIEQVEAEEAALDPTIEADVSGNEYDVTPEAAAEVAGEAEAAPVTEPELPPSAAVAPAPAAAPGQRVSRTSSTRLPTAVRAMQQQGVRKRREFDIHALAVRDTQYALHELRRIAVLATLVIVTLIVLGFVLR